MLLIPFFKMEAFSYVEVKGLYLSIMESLYISYRYVYQLR